MHRCAKDPQRPAEPREDPPRRRRRQPRPPRPSRPGRSMSPRSVSRRSVLDATTSSAARSPPACAPSCRRRREDVSPATWRASTSPACRNRARRCCADRRGPACWRDTCRTSMPRRLPMPGKTPSGRSSRLRPSFCSCSAARWMRPANWRGPSTSCAAAAPRWPPCCFPCRWTSATGARTSRRMRPRAPARSSTG